jgi:hypothetical protein
MSRLRSRAGFSNGSGWKFEPTINAPWTQEGGDDEGFDSPLAAVGLCRSAPFNTVAGYAPTSDTDAIVGDPVNNSGASNLGCRTPQNDSFLSNRLIVAEAGVSAVTTYKRVGQGSLIPVGSAPNDQVAMCWIQRVGAFYFVANTGSLTVSRYRVEPNGQPVLLAAEAAHTAAAPIDMTESGGFLYVESGRPGLVAIGTVIAPVLVTGLAPNFSPIPRMAPPPLGTSRSPTRTGASTRRWPRCSWSPTTR